MSAEIKLRTYQAECIDAVFDAWAQGMKAPAVVLPTGAGKTVVFSHLVKRWQNDFDPGDWCLDRGARVVILVHRDELADQALAKLRAVLPADVSVGKVKAQDDDVLADVMVCSVQTLASANRRSRLSVAQGLKGRIGLIIVDECHHAAAASYRKVFDAFPDALRLGVTATLARGDGVGLGDVWDDVVYTKSVLWMQSRGYLCDVEGKRVAADIDMTGVKKSRGDFQAGDMGRALMEAEAHKPIVQAYLDHAKDRQGIVFTPTVDTAHATADEMNRSGIRTAVISGATPRDERQRIFEDYRTGRVQVLANCMVLTEGFDAPWAEVAVIARPTMSQPLYVQMVGRVLRTWPGKDKALVLDLVGASATAKLRTLVDLAPTEIREIQEGETLQEAAERTAKELNAPAIGGVGKFELKVKDVDLFGGSAHLWGRTPKGVMYLGCGEGYVVLWPSATAGLWDVVWAPSTGRWERTERTGMDLGMAMAWGEAEAENRQSFSTLKKARWRTGKASDAQIEFASRLGIDASGMSKGEASEAIDRRMAAERIDRYVKG